jgi:GNAT superfamily N-acetyltransferase
MSLRVETLTGPALLPWLPHLARLRVTVFRDWPYLYDGSDDYEQTYLKHYAESQDAAIVIAFDNDIPVGASTCMPLHEASGSVQAPFTANGWNIDTVCYFGESVLLSPYRGQGIGVAFFAGREAHAASLHQIEHVAFCAVQRPADHPARPADYVPLDAFWRKRGFTPHPDLVCRMSWRDIGEAASSEKPLAFWLKRLPNGANH